MPSAAIYVQISVEIISLRLVPWNLRKCVGIQRIRCRPFTFDKWNGTNPMQYVALIPPSNYSKIKFAGFDITIKEHRDKIWFGRVELLFRCSFRGTDSDPEPPEEEGEILQCGFD